MTAEEFLKENDKIDLKQFVNSKTTGLLEVDEEAWQSRSKTRWGFE